MSGFAGFSGFSDRALRFYEDLSADNTRAFWAENKSTYETQVREPMRALLEELEAEFGGWALFRPNRDIRFSADKSPYKTHQGALAGSSRGTKGVGFYVQIGADGLTAGGGYHSSGPDQVERYRRAVDEEFPGSELAGIVETLERDGFEIGGNLLRTRPRGYPADHPRLDLLRRTSLMAFRRYGAPLWLGTPEVLTEVRSTWRAVRPLAEWLSAHVGPAEEIRRPGPRR